jgi:hypothetical protein
MTPEHESRPDERHEDLTRINNTFDSAIAEATRSVLKWLVPMIGAGVLAMVANYFESRSTKENVEKLNERMEMTNEKVLIMWYGGDWPRRQGHADNPDQTQ